MFSSNSISGNEIEIDAPAQVLMLLLQTIRVPAHVTALTWNAIEEGIKLAELYDCETASQDMLYSNCKICSPQYLFDAFVIACRQIHLLAASRILLRAGETEINPTVRSHRPEPPKSLRPTSGQWSLADSEQISSSWLWALTCAVDKVAKKEGMGEKNDKEWHRTDIWVQVVGEFMAHLVKCESIFTHLRAKS